ncbi:putative solute carrier family 22 member 23-like [Triplophysa rosa]|uniref:Solute carrier family 22 member 23-like n=1 Tax=Triplophysa rosa TaxID=992332 RepID=A0A9W7WHG7_TRIRA|nr:putative solute carrier family 22 member 23-like [Triplophysa rosa]
MDAVRLDALNPPAENGNASQSEAHKRLSQVDSVVLPFLGGFGRYQRRLVALTWIPAVLISFSQFSDYFLLGQPDKKCVRPDEGGGGNGTGADRGLLSELMANGTGLESAHGTACLCSEWRFELQSGLQQNVVTRWTLVCDGEWKVHIAKFSLLVGSIFGYVLMGAVADWLGRIPVLLVSVLSVLVFGLAMAFSVDMAMFSTLRFFEGFCLAAIRLSLYVLTRFSMTMHRQSASDDRRQATMTGLQRYAAYWQDSSVGRSCSPPTAMFPESLRWLLATQHYQRAKRQMYRIAQSNRVDTTTDPSGILSELEAELQQRPETCCVTQLRSTRNLWKNTVVLCVNSLTGYGIHHCFARSVVEGSATHLHYYALAAIATASCMVVFPVVGGFGRRGGLLTFMIITALASLLQLGLLNLIGKYSLRHDEVLRDTLNQRFSYAFSIIGMFSSHAVSTLSIFYCAEITPTVIRGGGVGLVLASAGFGMLTAPLMELHNQKGFFLHHVILTCCTLLCIICIPLLPETRGQPLPETLADGEGLQRRPLLPGEQHHLLAATDVREYSRVQDTPLHQAVNPGNGTVPSNSTANGVRTS